MTETMRPLLKTGMVVIDIGANIGYYTLVAASRVGDTRKVIAFESSATNCALLQMSVNANDFHNVVIHTNAVADFDGMVAFSMDGSNGSINRHELAACPYQVHAVRLNTLLTNEPQIDLVKMDIEGAEGLALAGMCQLLIRHRPIVFTEFSPNALGSISGIKPEDYLSHLRDLGYALYVVHRARGRHLVPQSNEEIMHDYADCQSDHLDLVAYPRGGTATRH